MACSSLAGYCRAVQGGKSQEQTITRSAGEVKELVTGTEDLVPRVLRHLKLAGIHADRDELLAFGHQGLVEAAHRFDSSKGEEFRKFAYFRVRGAMLDGMRKMGDWSRRGYERVSMMRALNETTLSHADETSSTAQLSSLEAAARLRAHMAAVTTAMTTGVFAEHVVSKNGEVLTVDTRVSVEESLGDHQMAARVRLALESLPPPEDEVIRRFYIDGERMDEIASDFGCSKSWVSRIHSRALKRMGCRLRPVLA